MFHKRGKCIFLCFMVLTAVFFTLLVYVFLHSYYLCSYGTVKNMHDPRWRIFDYNSRQASEDEVYNVAEIPVLKHVRLTGERKLRFEFNPPIKTKKWTIIRESDQRIVSEGKYPEIQFPDSAYTETYRFEPEGIALIKDIAIKLGFYPKENYRKDNLSWPDNYWMESISIPVSLECPRSVDEWAGLKDSDHEVVEARRILGNTVDTNASTPVQIEQVYRFVMENTNFAHETPSDEMQASSPLETYRLFNSGKGKGWCENHALVYYLFANAAGIKTRLIDVAGKLGPLKLTGHYFCESWIPEFGGWAYVDPETFIVGVMNDNGVPLSTLELKRLIDLDVFSAHSARIFDLKDGVFVTKKGSELHSHLKDFWMMSVMKGNIVIGYKFGYGNKKSFSKIKNFLGYTTLLYSPFALPKLYLVKYTALYGFLVCLVLSVVSGICLVFWCNKAQPQKGAKGGTK